MLIKIAKVRNKYYIADCDNESLIGKEIKIDWEQIADLENYFDVDDKGALYDLYTGACFGFLEIVK